MQFQFRFGIKISVTIILLVPFYCLQDPYDVFCFLIPDTGYLCLTSFFLIKHTINLSKSFVFLKNKLLGTSLVVQ